jgi:D-alanyl-D-alanine carboxypeptidase (penicillin-binding protein 5/6)
LPWPKVGSAAVLIPQVSVAASSPNQPKSPIASLTKMMTAWVILHRLPLTYTQRGPCLNVSASDVAAYDYDVASGQSNVEIVLGMRICEGTLLRGLLVHSAGDYAQLLVSLAGLNDAQFVMVMNRDARVLGLRHTHYVDYTGIGPGNVSTAHDQAMIAAELMASEPIIRRIVALTQVALPVAGVVGSYTPLIGNYGVIGVKSGYTNPAGGCDVMAINVVFHRIVVTTYAVVLGQHGSNPLALAGDAALALSRSLKSSLKYFGTSTSDQVKWIGWPGDVVLPPPTTTTTTTTTTTSTSTTTTTTVPAG